MAADYRPESPAEPVAGHSPDDHGEGGGSAFSARRRVSRTALTIMITMPAMPSTPPMTRKILPPDPGPTATVEDPSTTSKRKPDCDETDGSSANNHAPAATTPTIRIAAPDQTPR
jgi:hypothetical protein